MENPVDFVKDVVDDAKKRAEKPTRYDVRVEVWQERDRLRIGIEDTRTGKYIADWWDEGAAEMFEDGFFKSSLPFNRLEQSDQTLVNSVLDYAEYIGILAKP